MIAFASVFNRSCLRQQKVRQAVRGDVYPFSVMDRHRQAAWTARWPMSSPVARAKRLPRSGPSGQTIGCAEQLGVVLPSLVDDTVT